jgi:hypothetical protein
MKWIMLFFIPLYSSLAMDFSEIIYLDQESLANVIHGNKEHEIRALGDDGNRIFHANLERSKVELKTLEEIANTVTPVFPYAVIIGDELFNKDDDKCTKVPNSWRTIDVTRACMIHDYCYFRIPTDKQTFKEAFHKCHDTFRSDMIEAYKLQCPDKPLVHFGLLYEMGVRHIPYSYTNYVFNMDKNAILNTLILERYMNDAQFKSLLDKTKVLNPQRMAQQIRSYCAMLATDKAFKLKGEKVTADKVITHREHPRDNIPPGQFFGCAKKDQILDYFLL